MHAVKLEDRGSCKGKSIDNTAYFTNSRRKQIYSFPYIGCYALSPDALSYDAPSPDTLSQSLHFKWVKMGSYLQSRDTYLHKRT